MRPCRVGNIENGHSGVFWRRKLRSAKISYNQITQGNCEKGQYNQSADYIA